MDWVTFSASVAASLLSGGLIIGLLGWRLELWKFRHQTEQDKWAGIQESYEKQIDSAEKRGDAREAKRLRLDYEAQQEAWRAQQGVEFLAPRSITVDRPTTLTTAELERLRALLAESQGLNPVALVAEGHWLRGNAYHESGEYQQAVGSYTVAIRLRPESSEAYNNRGSAYRNLGEYQKAIADYNEALRLRPESPEAYNNRGNAYGNLGEHQKAIADYNEALRLRPDHPEAYNNRGVDYGSLGEHQKAIEDFNEALRLRPEYANAYYNLAWVYSLQQDIEACIENLERAVALDAKCKEQGRSDPDLERARQDERVRKLLGMD